MSDSASQHDPVQFLKDTLTTDNFDKLMTLKNPTLHDFIATSIKLCKPSTVFVCTDDPEDIAYIRRQAIERGEETPLKMEGHTIHYDGPNDQARDKANTRYLVPEGESFGKNLAQIEREKGLAEVKGFLDGIMAGKEMIVRFFCLGTTRSDFSISCIQLTDSFYVAHSEDILYRTGFEQFKTLGDSPEFFRVLHSAGRLTDTYGSEKLPNPISADVDKRRIFIDYTAETVYSVNTQYAGNTIGFKKLAHRLAIRKADRENWLAEHMFINGAHGPNGRVTYFTGAFPSACGKTSTAMIKGETIVGDDLAYLRKRDGKVFAVNVESGVFGIIRDVNPKDDPMIWKVLMSPGEVIFSNVLMSDGVPYWLGDGRDTPENGVNFAGSWQKGKTDDSGAAIPHAHKNARYTIRIADLANRDEHADNPAGVPVGGIIYGGRDSSSWVPVNESFDWAHGVITMGASLESETTAATLGKEGVRAFQPMSNMDFISLPLGKYLQNHLDFVKGLDNAPKIFAVNYFLKDENGEYLNGMNDKNVWLKWMELRAHDDVSAIQSPIGLIPKYDDLTRLFKEVLDKTYSEKDYVRQFSMRIPHLLDKLDRIDAIYRDKISDTPPIFFEITAAQRKRLEALKAEKGDVVSPLDL